MDDLITWLKAQIDDDEREQAGVIERVGRALADADLETFPGAYEARKEYYDGLAEAALKAAGFDPARVLREVEAKRRTIEWCVEVIGERDLSRYGEFGLLKDDPDALAVTLAVEQLKITGLPFSDRPGYQESWKP